jgi:uncharacterized protein (DUF305 family)
MNRTHARTRLAALTGAVLALSAGSPVRADDPAPTRAQAQYEVRFMTEMIDHHSMAVEMAQMCLTNATVHEELQTLCGEIITAQTQEIATMQSWLQSWYGITYSPQMMRGMQQHMERMAQMSGAEFEIAFMKSMIRHHWRAVVSASGCIDRAYHPELVDMCANIVETQVAEITQMRTWLCEWYAICNYGPKRAVQ